MNKDITLIPSHLSQNEALLEALQDFLLTKTEWGKCLGITRRTIFRWEQEIIKLVFIIFKEYKKPKRNYLDNYQRFILLVIFAKKQERLKDIEIKSWLRQNGQQLSRENFMAWHDRVSSVEGANKLYKKYKIYVWQDDLSQTFHAEHKTEDKRIELKSKSISDLMHLILSEWFEFKL